MTSHWTMFFLNIIINQVAVNDHNVLPYFQMVNSDEPENVDDPQLSKSPLHIWPRSVLFS